MASTIWYKKPQSYLLFCIQYITQHGFYKKPILSFNYFINKNSDDYFNVCVKNRSYSTSTVKTI